MHSRVNASELLLGDIVTTHLSTQSAPSVLIGGLGLGYTLKSVLENVPLDATVVVAELLPQIVDWNRTLLASLNGAALEDKRVQIKVADVRTVISGAPAESFDAILLDTDNGPTAMVQPENARLYSRTGLQRIAAALKPGGRLAVWSAQFDAGFAKRLASAGFTGQTVPAKRYPNAKRDAVTIYVADKPKPDPSAAGPAAPEVPSLD